MEPLALRFALVMARRGLPVFPLQPGTKEVFTKGSGYPSLSGGIHIATTSEAKIRGWFALKPDINYAVSTSKLVVLDFDAADGKRGLDTLASLDLPPTLVVETPRYGQHWYFQGPGVGQRDLGPGVNVRSINGYVVGPGSMFAGRFYSPRKGCGDLPIAPCPDHVRALLSKPAERAKTSEPVAELDDPRTWDFCVSWITTEPGAIRGERGSTAYRLAARLKDYGLSEEAARDLLEMHWVPRCDPPPEPHQWQPEVAHAYTYGRNAPGSDAPIFEFEDVSADLAAEGAVATLRKPETAAEHFRPLDIGRGPAALPARPWLIREFMEAKALTALVAPPGAGKSTHALALAIGIAVGRLDFLGLELARPEPSSVVLVNNEDDEDELLRRLYAMCMHHSIDWDLARDRIIIHAAPDDTPYVAFRRNGKTVVKDKEAFGRLEAAIVKHKAAAFILDPYAEVQEANEADNSEVIKVMKEFRALARRHSCAGLVVHHTRKRQAGDSPSGDQEAARGAIGFAGIVRGMYTIHGMTPQEAEEYGLTESDRRRHSRLDRAKGNHTAPDDAPRWYKTLSMTIANGDSAPAIELAKLASQDERDDQTRLNVIELLTDKLAEGPCKWRDVARILRTSPWFANADGGELKTRLLRLFKKPVDVGSWRVVATVESINAELIDRSEAT